MHSDRKSLSQRSRTHNLKEFERKLKPSIALMRTEDMYISAKSPNTVRAGTSKRKEERLRPGDCCPDILFVNQTLFIEAGEPRNHRGVFRPLLSCNAGITESIVTQHELTPTGVGMKNDHGFAKFKEAVRSCCLRS